MQGVASLWYLSSLRCLAGCQGAILSPAGPWLICRHPQWGWPQKGEALPPVAPAYLHRAGAGPPPPESPDQGRADLLGTGSCHLWSTRRRGATPPHRASGAQNPECGLPLLPTSLGRGGGLVAVKAQQCLWPLTLYPPCWRVGQTVETAPLQCSTPQPSTQVGLPQEGPALRRIRALPPPRMSATQPQVSGRQVQDPRQGRDPDI